MKFTTEINVMPLKALLDPQGKAVRLSMHNTGFKSVENIRIGKHIHLELETDSYEAANDKVKEACEKILSNPVMEYFEFEVTEA